MSMAGYTKLFNSILASSIWLAGKETKLLWITMLAMAGEDGIAHAAVPGLAHMSGLTIPEVEKSLQELSSPDKFSRTKDHDGRRVQEVDGGWLLLNHAKYRAKMGADERREYKRLKQQEYRDRAKRGKRGRGVEKRAKRGQSGHIEESESESQPESKAKARTNERPALDGKLLDEIACPSCLRVGYLSQSPGRNGNPPGFWCRNTGGCNQNFPIDFEEIRSQMTPGARRALEAIAPKDARQTKAEQTAAAIREGVSRGATEGMILTNPTGAR